MNEISQFHLLCILQYNQQLNLSNQYINRVPSKVWPPPQSTQTQTLPQLGTSEIQTKGRKIYWSTGLVQLVLNFLEVRGPHRVLVNARGHPVALLGADRQRGPDWLCNWAVPGLVQRVSRWLLSVMAMGDPGLQWKFCWVPGHAGVWGNKTFAGPKPSSQGSLSRA
jgi:hypothetical protein